MDALFALPILLLKIVLYLHISVLLRCLVLLTKSKVHVLKAEINSWLLKDVLDLTFVTQSRPFGSFFVFLLFLCIWMDYHRAAFTAVAPGHMTWQHISHQFANLQQGDDWDFFSFLLPWYNQVVIQSYEGFYAVMVFAVILTVSQLLY